MTTPELPKNFRDPQLMSFKERFALNAPSKFIPYTDLGLDYGPDWCHVSSKLHALRHSGKRVHGWSCWLYPQGLMAEFHSVWESPKGALVDLTPPKFGSDRVLFIRDPMLRIDAFNDGIGDGYLVPVNRMSPPFDPYWFDGKPFPSADWLYPRSNASFVAYCATMGFDPEDYPTDPNLG